MTPRRSKRLQSKETDSAKNIERLKQKRFDSEEEDNHSPTSNHSNQRVNTSSSDNGDTYITPVKQFKSTNNFTKVYNSYNMDKGLDGYEADFIDDEEYKSSHKKKKQIVTPVRKRRKQGVVIIESDDEEEATPSRCGQSKRRHRTRIDSSSSSEVEMNNNRKKRRMLKMDSDDELDIPPQRERSSRARLLQQQKDIKRERQLKELKGIDTTGSSSPSDEVPHNDSKEEKKRVFPIHYESSSSSSNNEMIDEEDEEEYDSDWIVPDDNDECCSLDGWEITTGISLCNNLSHKMSFEALLKQSCNEEQTEYYQFISSFGGRTDQQFDIYESITDKLISEVDLKLDNYDTTLLHIIIGRPFDQFNSKSSDNKDITDPDVIAHSHLVKLYEFQKKWFIKMLKDGLNRRPNIIEMAIWYKRQKCTHYLINICNELCLHWQSSITNELYCTGEDQLWPCNYLQLALLSHVIEEEREGSSAAGIINIIFPYFNQDDVNSRDEQGFTAVMYAAQLGDWETLTIFLKSHYVSFDVKDYEGRSLLHIAAASGSLLCVEQLLDYGHVVNCKDNKGWPPLLYAHFSGHEDCFLLLMKTNPLQLSVLTDLLQCQDSDNKKKTAKVVRELLLSLAHSESYYNLFNQFVCNNLNVLDDGSFGFMKHCMSLVSFENKQAWLKKKLSLLKEESYNSQDYDSYYYDTTRLSFRDMPRTGLLKEVLLLLHDVTSRHYRGGPPDVTFINEPGICTGPRREFWTCLSHELADGCENIFTKCDDSKLSLQPYHLFTNYQSTDSLSSSDHLSKVNTVGSLLATAVMYGDTLDCTLSLPLVKQLVGQKICTSDLEDSKGDLYRQLMYLKEDTVEGLELTFSTTLICPWTQLPVDIELKESGMKEQVNNLNKNEYIHYLSLFTLMASIRHEIRELKKGFWKVIPKHYISVFTPNEFSLLLSGVPHIDVQDWKDNTKYSGRLSSSHSVALWFWKLVEDLTEHEKGLLLKFTTGSPRLPPGGFASLQGLGSSCGFTLSLGQGIDKIPHAQTCFNLLVLSDYSSEQELRNKSLIAIRYGCEGFAFS